LMCFVFFETGHTCSHTVADHFLLIFCPVHNSRADQSHFPPAPGIPILATLASTADSGSQPDQANTQNLPSFRTDSSPSSSIESNTTPTTAIYDKSHPIPILSTPKDANRVITPLSGRGERTGSDYFSSTRSPSPSGRYFSVGSQQSRDGCSIESGSRRRRSSSSHLSRSLFVFKMEQHSNSRYTPTSPLSPRLPPANRPVSPQPGRARAAHRRQPSRNMQLNLPRYHPANYQSSHQPAMESPTSAAQSSGFNYHRISQTESPRLMRERQREFIDRARMSSKFAASPMGIKPQRPTLVPLGSPKGNVTPLALEEGHDYFQVAGAERISPAQSPGAISNGSTKEFGEELAKKTPKTDGSS
jgi:hypothetical protein